MLEMARLSIMQVLVVIIVTKVQAFFHLESHDPGDTPRKVGRGYVWYVWYVCGPLPKTLTIFMTKICDFSLPYL